MEYSNQWYLLSYLETVNIFYKGKPSGRVFLSVQTIPQGPQGGGCFPHGHKGPGFGHQGGWWSNIELILIN